MSDTDTVQQPQQVHVSTNPQIQLSGANVFDADELIDDMVKHLMRLGIDDKEFGRRGQMFVSLSETMATRDAIRQFAKDNDFVNNIGIKKICAITKKSESTIRNFLSDREYQPQPDTMKAMRKWYQGEYQKTT